MQVWTEIAQHLTSLLKQAGFCLMHCRSSGGQAEGHACSSCAYVVLRLPQPWPHHAAQTAAAAVNAGGTVVTVGMGCEHARLPVTSMTVREVTMAGSFRYANTVSPRLSCRVFLLFRQLPRRRRCDCLAACSPSLPAQPTCRCEGVAPCLTGSLRQTCPAAACLLHQSMFWTPSSLPWFGRHA